MNDDFESIERMTSGEWYLATGGKREELAQKAALLFHEYNQIGPTHPERSAEILATILNPHSGNCTIKAPAIIEYGFNTTIGEHVFINFGLTILDIAPVRIGARSMLGPNCQLLTASHPVDDWQMRSGGWENGSPIMIGEDTWLGGNVTVVGGVRIGDRCVIGAGAVVTKDIPDDSIAVGNPARVIRKRDDAYAERTQLPENAPVDAFGVLPEELK
ncbi:sugar O-acetyltransferase [Corynebacterium crudilactis]|uniref:Galactoside O-acetyltransferase n=1 Tax=Corynebacterium crudilactis TaxID=1652495 RepID=A0A172QQC7_9CORY|nr:sugar O-acetyltransferase [Corynebacterium crudilactis]ANE02895.1 galactoside O-acetyltransferase [Corynebacterium crudilactis]